MEFKEISTGLFDLITEKPIADRHRVLAARHLRDWFACYMAGGATEQGRIFREYAGRKPDLEQSVFCVAALSRITESDDIHRNTLTRPGSVVIPIAMVLGRHLGCNGTDVLDAIITGYEVSIRFGNALLCGAAANNAESAKGKSGGKHAGNLPAGASKQPSGGKSHIWAHEPELANAATVFGAAATAASLMKLDRASFPEVLALAAAFAGGPIPLASGGNKGGSAHAAHAAQSGLRAARLASRGYKAGTGALAGLNGLKGRPHNDALSRIVLAETSGWLIGETSIKPWPSCRFTHSAVDAALKVRGHLVENPFEGIKTVTLHMPAEALLYDGTISVNGAMNGAARLHPAYSACLALIKGAPGIGDFDPEQAQEFIRNPLMKKAKMVHHKPFDTHPGRWPVRLDVGLDSGMVLTETVDVPLGDPEFPMSDAELDAKVISHLLYAGFNEEGAQAMLKSCREVIHADSIPQCWWLRSDEDKPSLN